MSYSNEALVTCHVADLECAWGEREAGAATSHTRTPLPCCANRVVAAMRAAAPSLQASPSIPPLPLPLPPCSFQIDRRKYHPAPKVHGCVVRFMLTPPEQRLSVPSEAGFVALVSCVLGYFWRWCCCEGVPRPLCRCCSWVQLPAGAPFTCPACHGAPSFAATAGEEGIQPAAQGGAQLAEAAVRARRGGGSAGGCRDERGRACAGGGGRAGQGRRALRGDTAGGHSCSFAAAGDRCEC